MKTPPERPIRTCVGCRKTDTQRMLVRIVLDGRGRVKVDRERKMAGRGAWLHETRACVEKAIHNSGLPRAFRRRTQPVDQLTPGALWAELTSGNKIEDGTEHE
jgi:predicted RNA-binding protein YlxR (DUF448 family)